MDVNDTVVRAPEQLNPGLDELVEQVHVLQSPTLDGDVEATRSDQVSFVYADDAETVVSPQARFGREHVVVVAGDLARVDNLGVVLAEDDGKVRLLPEHGVSPTPAQEVGSEQQVHVTVEEQGIVGEVGRADLQGQGAREGAGNRLDLHVCFGILHVVLPHELDLLDALRVVVRAEEQNEKLDVLVGDEADLLEVGHETNEDLVASRQRYENVDLFLFGFVLFYAGAAELKRNEHLERVGQEGERVRVLVDPGGQHPGVHLLLLPELNLAEGLLKVGVSPDWHRHGLALVLLVKQQQIEHVLRPVHGVDPSVAVLDLFEVDDSASRLGVGVDHLHNLHDDVVQRHLLRGVDAAAGRLSVRRREDVLAREELPF